MQLALEIDEQFAGFCDRSQIEAAVQAVLEATQSTESSVAISITDSAAVQQLNFQYRQINAPTDVLSFSYQPDPDFPEPATAEIAGHLGDIIIAYPVAQAQAEISGHTPMDEIVLLVVHGMLHLLGFDHDSKTNKASMWSIQSSLLTKLNLTHVQPTEN
jgi:probable rRNA maturation factor